MADFCSLCGYGDLDIDKSYNKLVKPMIESGHLEKMTGEENLQLNFAGVCEHCGIMSLQIHKNRQVFVVLCNSPNVGIEYIGIINQNLDLIIDKDSDVYKRIYLPQYERFLEEIEAMEREYSEFKENNKLVIKLMREGTVERDKLKLIEAHKIVGKDDFFCWVDKDLEKEYHDLTDITIDILNN